MHYYFIVCQQCEPAVRSTLNQGLVTALRSAFGDRCQKNMPTATITVRISALRNPHKITSHHGSIHLRLTSRKQLDSTSPQRRTDITVTHVHCCDHVYTDSHAKCAQTLLSKFYFEGVNNLIGGRSTRSRIRRDIVAIML